MKTETLKKQQTPEVFREITSIDTILRELEDQANSIQVKTSLLGSIEGREAPRLLEEDGGVVSCLQNIRNRIEDLSKSLALSLGDFERLIG